MGNYFPMHEGARKPLPHSDEVAKAWAELKDSETIVPSVWTEPFPTNPPGLTRTINETTGHWEFAPPDPTAEQIARNIPGDHEYVDGLDYKELIAYLNGVIEGLKAAGQ